MSYQQNSAASGYAQTAATGQYPPGYTKETYEAYCKAYYAQQQAAASATSVSRTKSSKSSSSRKEQATLLEVEKQWAAYYEQQRAAGISNPAQRNPEPDFTAFTLAGGRSYLEDGSPNPLSSNGRGGKSAGH